MKASHVAMCCLTAMLLSAVQVLANGMVELRIETVLATNASKEVDNRLNDMQKQLQIFRYSSYHLVQEERRRVSWGKQADFFLPGGRFLHVVPKELADQRIALQVMLMEGSAPTPLINTSLKFPNHGMVFFAGRKHQDGVLIIRIGATVEE
jgi:hypothetical protein